MLKKGIFLILFMLSAVLVISVGNSSSAQEWDIVYGDIIMDKKAESMKEGKVDAVLFPHWFHRIRYRCKVCHEDIFKQEKGGNDISMDSISRGEHCGACHDGRAAWDPLYCERCHAVKMPAATQVAKAPGGDGPATFKSLSHPGNPSNEEIEPLDIANPDDPKSVIYASRTGKLAGTGDPRKPKGEAYKWGLGWQPRALKSEGFPRDRYGLVLWAKMAKEGTIFPKGAVEPDNPNYSTPVQFEFANEEEDIEDIKIKTKSNFMSNVLFPHTLHAWWLDCKSCHPHRFVRTAGDTNMSMQEMAKGKYCGECHGKVSFSLSDCNRCHTLKKSEGEAKTKTK